LLLISPGGLASEQHVDDKPFWLNITLAGVLQYFGVYFFTQYTLQGHRFKQVSSGLNLYWTLFANEHLCQGFSVLPSTLPN